MDSFRLWMRLFELFRFRDRILQFLGLTERAGKVDDLLKQLGAVMVRIEPYGMRDRILFGFQAAVAHAWLPMKSMLWLGPQTGLPTSRGA
ncbi:MAG: hypothetical protein Q9199_007407 [Rusavskia elegans]